MIKQFLSHVGHHDELRNYLIFDIHIFLNLYSADEPKLN